MKTRNATESAIQSFKRHDVTVHVGDAAWEQLSSVSFLTNWDKLFEECPWATIFQHQSFVITWYQVYKSKYQPIIITAEYGDKLTGLLSLAIPTSSSKGHIVGAGHFAAEYHTWLTDGADNGRFIQSALSKVLALFPHFSIYLRFIPTQTPIQWTGSSYWKKKCVLLAASRPLMDMSDPEINKVFRKDDLKLKLNRLKKFGEVVFEQIIDKAQFTLILEELTTLYDFRQGAMFNKNQFKEDPLKVDFLLALFEQNLLHVTVLKVNGQLFASISAVSDQKWVYLCGGFNVHAPFYAKRLSPGFISFMLLGQHLINDGIAVLDLTPGGDAYKERMATRHELVHELMVTNNPIYRIKRKLRKQAYVYLAKAGKWPMGTELALRKQLYMLKSRIQQIKKRGLLKTAVEKIRQIIQPPKRKVFAVSAISIPPNCSLAIKRNALNDLLCFEAEGTWKTRWAFLEDAMRRYGVGDSSYTYCKNGRLLHCIWLSKNKNAAETGKKTTKNTAQNASFQLDDMYCHPMGKKWQSEFISAAAAAAAIEQKEGELYAVVSSEDKSLCRTLEVIGFKVTNSVDRKVLPKNG
jgi:hypothetical protein